MCKYSLSLQSECCLRCSFIIEILASCLLYYIEIFIFILYVWAFACKYIRVLFVCLVLTGARRGVGFPGPGVTCSELHYGSWEPNQSPQSVLLTTETSFQRLIFLFFILLFHLWKSVLFFQLSLYYLQDKSMWIKFNFDCLLGSHSLPSMAMDSLSLFLSVNLGSHQSFLIPIIYNLYCL